MVRLVGFITLLLQIDAKECLEVWISIFNVKQSYTTIRGLTSIPLTDHATVQCSCSVDNETRCNNFYFISPILL